MKLTVKHQEHYSRLELLLRSILGIFYIVIPHGFLLFFVSIWGAILKFIAFWIVLFTAKYPQSIFDFQVGLMKWNLRLSARMFNLSDGYPAFGISGTDEYTNIEVHNPERISRGLVLLRLFLGVIYVYIPHGFMLFFRAIFIAILAFLAWWIVLFSGHYPASFHNWVTGQLRWSNRLNLYMSFMTDKYPPFTGDVLPDEL